MTISAGVEGSEQLAARLTRAHDGVMDLSEPNRQAAQLVAHKATLLVPKATGALGDSDTITVTGSGWGIAYGKPYAPKVHWGTRLMRPRPWLTDAARATEDSWMDVLTDHVQQLLDD